MKKGKRKIGFSDSARFNYELDTNQKLKRGLEALAEQMPHITQEKYRARMLELFKESGLELDEKELEMLLLLRMKTDQMLLTQKNMDKD